VTSVRCFLCQASFPAGSRRTTDQFLAVLLTNCGIRLF
jgi:hypothetical protein